MAPGENKKKDGDIVDSTAEVVQSEKKSPKHRKAKLIDEGKSASQQFVQSKESETVSEVKAQNENGRKRKKEAKPVTSQKKKEAKPVRNGKNDAAKDVISHHRNKERKITNEKHEERKKREQKSGKSIGGMIFMCNAKTKPDCFHYRVMGVSTSKLELVMRIKPGLKLFLYDFDLKMMYGIYEASSIGGMKLEPAAFAGAFPAQVRFKIHKDCLPLPEGVFKKAIKDSYDEKTHKFKTELTVEQVKRLTELFRAAPQLHSNAKASVERLVPVPIVQRQSVSALPSEEPRSEHVYREQYGSIPRQGSITINHDDRHIIPNDAHSRHPLFLTEREYRSYGLHSERPLLPTAAPVGAPTGHTYDNYMFDRKMEQLPSNQMPVSINADIMQKEPGRKDLFFLSEKEYRTYGLQGYQEPPKRLTSTLETNRSFEDSIKAGFNPYDDSTTSLVNRYLSLPGSVAPAESYYLTGRGAHLNVSSSTNETKDHLGRLNPEGERPNSLYASHALSDYDQNYHRLGGEPDFTPSTVSSRYSFGGPSFSRR